MPKLSSDTFTKAHQDHGNLDAGGGTGRRQESDAGAIDQSFGIGPLRRGEGVVQLDRSVLDEYHTPCYGGSARPAAAQMSGL